MLRSIRALSTMSKDPAFPILLEECASLAGGVSKKQYISVALNLLEEDHTVPFIARYRREQTGDIPVNDLYELQRKWSDFTATIKLRTSRLAALEASGRCTEEVRRAFFACITKEELDELYATYKEVKTAKSELISAFSVSTVADEMMEGKQKFYVVSQEAADVAKSSKYSVFDAISYHCAGTMSSDLSIKDQAKDQFTRHPTIVTTSLTTAYKALQKSSLQPDKDKNKSGSTGKPVKSGTGESAPKLSELHKYKDYHSVNRRITQLAAHQLLAIRRGKEAGVLAINLSPDETAKDIILRFINRKYNVFHHANAPAKDSSHHPAAERAGYRIGRDDVLSSAAKEAVSKLCASLTKKQWKDAITKAEIEAAEVFSTSLRPLLLTAPLRTVIGSEGTAGSTVNSATVVCAVDPGFAHGHKWVVLAQASSNINVAEGMQAKGNETSILCYGKIFENSSKHPNEISFSSPLMLSSPAQLADVLVKYNVTAVAIGNGTGSREAQAFVSAALEHASSRQSNNSISANTSSTLESKQKRKHTDLTEDTHRSSNNATSAVPTAGCVGYAVVSEAGASVYSASERAREEFPPSMLDIAYVGAVSIGRRLVDPLSELIKVQPASLGVGMYQHDLSDKGITDRLRNVVEDCVNVVGVDVNTASADLLRYVSGLNDTNVKEIMAHRSGSAASLEATVKKASSAKKTSSVTPGRLMSLSDLRGVKGIGPKTFSNCAGFLRVYNGTEPLDATNIHPDDYALARDMLKIYKKENTASIDTSLPEAKKSRKKDKTDRLESSEEAEQQTATAPMQENSSKAGSSFWERCLRTAVEGGAKKDPYALLRAKSAAELEQIWTWLQEAHLAPVSSASASLSKGPYMSAPKLLQRLPVDFQAKIEVGSIVQGVIRNVTTFGAFVDLGGVEIHSADSSGSSSGGNKSKGKASCDGLLHSSKYRDYFNKRAAGAKTPGTAAMAMASEIYVGREVKVKIIAIDDAGASGGKSDGHDKRRISLDLLELL